MSFSPFFRFSLFLPYAASTMEYGLVLLARKREVQERVRKELLENYRKHHPSILRNRETFRFSENIIGIRFKTFKRITFTSGDDP